MEDTDTDTPLTIEQIVANLKRAARNGTIAEYDGWLLVIGLAGYVDGDDNVWLSPFDDQPLGHQPGLQDTLVDLVASAQSVLALDQHRPAPKGDV